MDQQQRLAEPLLLPADGAPSTTRPQLMRVQTFAEDGHLLDASAPLLLEPLIERISEQGSAAATGQHDAAPPAAVHADNSTATTLSLSKVILGSGMLVRAAMGGETC